MSNQDEAVIKGRRFYCCRFQRLDVAYSMVVEWCEEQFGGSHTVRTASGLHSASDTIDTVRWMEDGGNFYFRSPADRVLFNLRWQ